MADVLGNRRDIFDQFNFRVEVDGITAAAFQKCSELALEVGVVEFRQGGSRLAQKSPGLVTIPDLTLEYGVTKDLDFWNWMLEVVDPSQGGKGRKTPLYTRDLDIVCLDRDDEELQRWHCKDTWPRKVVLGQFDATAESKQMGSVILVVKSFKPTKT